MLLKSSETTLLSVTVWSSLVLGLLFQHSMLWQTIDEMECAVWVCGTILKYLLIRKANVDALQSTDTALSIVCCMDMREYGIAARRMVWDTLQSRAHPRIAELPVSRLEIYNHTNVLQDNS